MIPTGPFWMICYRGHQICRTEFERTDNQGCRKAALNFSRYSLLSVYEFEKIRKNDYYYVDKTELIQALVKTEPAEITLFTRPRRFGKTLVMSMLASFFDIRRDSRDLFEGLKIAEDQKLCELWMNQ